MQSNKFKKRNGKEFDQEKVDSEDRESNYQSLLSVITHGRQEKEHRDKNRKLEREIVGFYLPLKVNVDSNEGGSEDSGRVCRPPEAVGDARSRDFRRPGGATPVVLGVQESRHRHEIVECWPDTGPLALSQPHVPGAGQLHSYQEDPEVGSAVLQACPRVHARGS